MFGLPEDQALHQKLPGFVGGLTVTTHQGRIIGESFLLRLGENFAAAKILAAATCLNVVYEAIGKSVPTKASERESDFNRFAGALDQALQGIPQNIHYQGFHMRVLLSKRGDNEILLAITPKP
jgi:hypothetical protein